MFNLYICMGAELPESCKGAVNHLNCTYVTSIYLKPGLLLVLEPIHSPRVHYTSTIRNLWEVLAGYQGCCLRMSYFCCWQLGKLFLAPFFFQRQLGSMYVLYMYVLSCFLACTFQETPLMKLYFISLEIFVLMSIRFTYISQKPYVVIFVF